MADVECVWPLAAQLGEGPVWCPADGALWFVDIKGGQIHCFSEATGERRSFATPELAAFVFPVRGGGFLCGLKSGLYRFDPSTSAFDPMVTVDAEHPGNRLNDGYVDAAGRLWFGTMDDRHAEPTGSLYRYAGGRLERMDAGYVITNGPAMSPDAKVLYHVDTLQRRVFAFDVDPAGGLSGRRPFITLTQPGEFPDGPTVDCEGNVWIALYGGWGVRCYSPAGRPLRTIAVPAAQCTKAAFGGADLRTLYITTAAQGLPEAERSQQPLAGGLFRVRVDVPGLESHAFSGWG
jgi:xylono-1,5-lactonase